MNVEIRTEAAQFLFWECRSRNFFAVWFGEQESKSMRGETGGGEEEEKKEEAQGKKGAQ
jgi:hypothetical protein